MMRARILVVCVALVANAAVAEPATGCADANIFGSALISNFNWQGIYPIRIAGGATMGEGRVPEDAAEQSTCICYDTNGVPEMGLLTAMWEPAKLIELTKGAGCLDAIGGIRMAGVDKKRQGTSGEGEFDDGDLAFYHYHTYHFPLLYLLSLFMESRCMADGLVDMDVGYLSEIDPTWNNEDLAFYSHPEATALANPVALAACALDSATSAAGEPTDSLFWCAGSWGGIYPFAGYDKAIGGFARNTSLLATRSVAALHRRGLMFQTMGTKAMCEGYIDPLLKKSQYKMSMLFPVAETESDHVIGESTFSWGMGRKLPGVGEDALYVLWRWNDCCLKVM